ncbi:MAG: adenylosuccinate synthase [Bacillota bacterium]|nr:MAG: adenylosuccinate synthase [Bacillota bacterium]MBS3950885.1 adenylosuccinate synthase [Peptococcaceae bacterium]
MTVKAVVGAQWGDEGKGKIVDLLAQEADIVVRFQGGANAGHTVVNSLGKFALHLVPCGIFNPDTLNIIGTGTVVDLDELIKEIDMLENKGISTANLRISNRAHISLPVYSQLERLSETERGERKQGSTLRGISPAYAAKALRVGLQMGSLHNVIKFRTGLTEVLEGGNRLITKIYGAEPLNLDEIVERYLGHARRLEPYVCDSLGFIQQGLTANKNILLEGQLGTMRDLDWGIYPYVTSSNPLPGGAAAGAGIPPHKITSVLGVVKAFSTSVGEGPFVTEQNNEVGNYLREVGLEFGATTGRPRRCGWLDAVGLKYAAMLNGFTEIAITKLDTLDGLESLKVCVGYKLDGKEIGYMPLTDDLYRVEPVYIDLPGWKQKAASARSWEQLPRRAQEYVRLIESYCSAPATLISVGPEREATFSR